MEFANFRDQRTDVNRCGKSHFDFYTIQNCLASPCDIEWGMTCNNTNFSEDSRHASL